MSASGRGERSALLRRGRPAAVIFLISIVGALAPGARAAVTIDPASVTVSAPGAAVTVTRQPFGMRFTDGAGRTVLSEVDGAGAAPAVVAPLPNPVPLGAQPASAPTLYAPLAFTVGADRSVQYPGAVWEGDQLAGTQAGIQYSARDVTAATRSGEGVVLTVSTNDPSGRELIVTLTPSPGAIDVSVRPSAADGVATMSDSFASGADEAFHGFGGRHNALDERGRDFYNWIEQEDFGAGTADPAFASVPGSGGHGYLFPNGPTAAYYVQTLFASSRPYGFLLANTELSRFRLDSDRPDAWQAAVGASTIDYRVAPGSAPQALATLTAATGPHRVPPPWGIGPALDRLAALNETPQAYQAQVEDDLRHIERGDIHISAYRIEGWRFYDEASLRKLIARLHALGIKALVYFRAFVDDSNGGTDSAADYQQAVSNGYVAKTATGQPYIFLDNFGSRAAVIDFTNPAAVRWWDGRITSALAAGADGFMEDFGEQTQVDMHFADGETGASMHNRYPVIYHATTRALLDSYERAHPGKRAFVFVRSGYNGSAGSEQSNFPGDETTDWSRSSGIQSLTTDMLNRAIGGAYGYSTDIGGYFDIGPYQPTTKELFIRWAEWAALSPTFRLHGSVGAGTHAPWTFDADTVAVYKDITALHVSAEPLILRLWAQADRSGMPVTRPLWLSYPDDPVAAREDQEWLLGPDLLVAPVVTQGATSRAVYFPRGCWESPVSGERHSGPGSATVAAALDSLPYFFRCGTRPFRPPVAAARLGCVPPRRLSLLIHQPQRGRITRVVVYVNGRRVKTVRGKRVARVTVSRPRVTRVTVRIVAFTTGGARTVSTRTYRGCHRGRPRTRVEGRGPRFTG